MLSLYIHIPFCAHKCSYCSFFILPENDATLVDKDIKLEQLKDKYLESLLAENTSRYASSPDKQLRTIYIGGGTPFELGEERLFELIDTLLEMRDVEFLEELTIELNPDPFDEVLDFIRHANRRYKHLYKLRFSIGIQTFDDEILESSKRNYVFNNLVWFFRDLQKIKQPFTHYNLDFISFGKQSPYPRNENKMEFFMKLVNSHVADGFSLYTLELFPGSSRYNQLQKKHHIDKQKTEKTHRLQGNDDAIMNEFDVLSTIITQAGYKRYEISNFALPSKRSAHNIVYRTMQPYIGMGINSSSFLPGTFLQDKKILDKVSDDISYRFRNTQYRKAYLAHDWLDISSIETIDVRTLLAEKSWLALRTDTGIQQLSTCVDILEPQWKELLTQWAQHDLILYNEEEDTLKLTKQGMSMYNTIVTDLFTTL